MKKIITNIEMLNVTSLDVYTAMVEIWVDSENRYKTYYYMDTPKEKLKKFPVEAVLSYNGSSDKKNVPNSEMHEDAMNSSKDVKITIRSVNEPYSGFLEQKDIFLHNWPHSRKPDPKTGKYNFGDDCYNQHASNTTKSGALSYADVVATIQYEKLIALIEEHEKDLTKEIFECVLKDLEWHNKIYYDSKSSRFNCNVQGRNLIATLTDNVNKLKDAMDKNPDPKHWRDNDPDGSPPYFLEEDEIPVGGNSRGMALPVSAMRNKGLYWYKIPKELYDVLSEKFLEFFSAWLNKRKTYTSEITDDETFKLRLKNLIEDNKDKLLTKKTEDAGGVPRFEPMHPMFSILIRGFEKTFSSTLRQSIFNSITNEYKKERTNEVQKEEGSIDSSDKGLKLPINKKYWDIKTKALLENLIEEIGRPLNSPHMINTTYGFLDEKPSAYLIKLRMNLKLIEKLKQEGTEDSIKEIEKTKKTMKYTEEPNDLVVFVTFPNSFKYKRFMKGEGSNAQPECHEAIKETINIKGEIFIIPVNPKVTTEERENNDNMDIRSSSLGQEYSNKIYSSKIEREVQERV